MTVQSNRPTVVFFALVFLASACAEAPVPSQPDPDPPPSPAAPSPPAPTVPPPIPSGGYSLALSVAPADTCAVDLAITTNVPGTIEVWISLALAGQKDDDFSVGLTRKAKLRGTTTVHLDGRDKADLPSEIVALPDGKYVASVSLMPNWGLSDDEAKASGLGEELTADAKAIALECGGPSAAVLKKRSANRKWVMLNVVSGDPWKPSVWTRKLGAYEEVPMTGDGNPEILKFYYFASADMTLMVNVLKGELVTFREGRVGA